MMKRHFDVESDGFYGAYWKCKTGSDCAMIAIVLAVIRKRKEAIWSLQETAMA